MSHAAPNGPGAPQSPPLVAHSGTAPRDPFALVTPNFRMSREDRYFAIGKGFSEDIERALARIGCPIESRAKEYYSREFRVPRDRESLITTDANPGRPLRTTAAILNDLRAALDPNFEFGESDLINVEGETWMDPHGHDIGIAFDPQTLMLRREMITEVTKRIQSCNVIIIGLGQIETWYDRTTRRFLNEAPPAASTVREPNRFEVRTLSYEENLENLEAIYTLLQTHGPSDLRIVIGVAPTPQLGTYLEQHLSVADCHAKSMLRTVADAWAQRHPNVQYFPVLEMVQSAAKETALTPDGHQLSEPLVDSITQQFVRAFFDGAQNLETHRWHLETKQPQRIITWPDYSSDVELDFLMREFVKPILERPGVALCIRHDVAADGPEGPCLEALGRAFDRVIGADKDFDVLLVNDGMSRNDWRYLNGTIHRSLKLPSAQDPTRAAFYEAIDAPMVDSRDHLIEWIERERRAPVQQTLSAPIP